MTVMFYHGSDNPVRVRDRVLVHGLFRRARLGTVLYVPGQGTTDPRLGNDQWAYQTDDGAIYAAGYAPIQFPHAGRRIEFVSRAGEESASVVPPEEPSRQPGRDLLALIGCGTLVALTIATGYGLYALLFRRVS